MKKSIIVFFSFVAIAVCQSSWCEPIKPDKSLGQSPTVEATKQNLSTNVWESIFIGVFSGLVSSLASSGIFWYFLYQKKPRILISPQIAKSQENGKSFYTIKVLNLTPVEVIDVKFELLLATVTRVNSETTSSGEAMTISQVKLEEIKIGRNEPYSRLMAIERYHKDDREAKYAIQLIIATDIESKCTNGNSFLLFKICATHASSGFSKVIEKRYDSPLNTRIKSGSFKGGKTMDIE